jgi:imidazolonepropionase-like amidohydrolase
MREGATHTKFMGTGGIISDTGPLRPQYSRPEVEALIEETHRHDKPVATHAYGGEGAIVAIEAGVDTIEHASRFGEEELDLVEGGDQFLVGTSAIYFHERGIEGEARMKAGLMEPLREVREDLEASWRRILERDVNVAVGTDSVRGAMPFEIEKLIEFGASPERAIAAATIDAARCVRREGTVGSIEPGKRADVVLLEDDPRENTDVLWDPIAVFHRGERVA